MQTVICKLAAAANFEWTETIEEVQRMRCVKLTIILATISLVTSCATGSTQMLTGSSVYSSGDCSVEVFSSKSLAEEAGIEKEICRVEGNSSFSFDHSIEGAIKKNVKKLCGCGVSKAYLASSHTQAEMGIKGVSHVNLIGFR